MRGFFLFWEIVYCRSEYIALVFLESTRTYISTQSKIRPLGVGENVLQRVLERGQGAEVGEDLSGTGQLISDCISDRIKILVFGIRLFTGYCNKPNYLIRMNYS